MSAPAHTTRFDFCSRGLLRETTGPAGGSSMAAAGRRRVSVGSCRGMAIVRARLRQRCAAPPRESQPLEAMSSDSRLLAFLNGVLAARGSQALPYKEDLKWNIRDHLMQLISARCPAGCLPREVLS